MKELSRRTLLVAATTLIAIPASRAAAAGPATAGTGPHSLAGAGLRASSLTGYLDAVEVTVTVVAEPDTAGIRVTLVNTGTAPEQVTVSYSDQTTGRRTRGRDVRLPAGRARTLKMHGHLQHALMISVCQASGTCLNLGPVGGPAVVADSGPQGFSVPPVDPG